MDITLILIQIKKMKIIRTFSSFEILSPSYFYHFSWLSQNTTMNHRLISATDCSRMMKDDHIGFEFPDEFQIFKFSKIRKKQKILLTKISKFPLNKMLKESRWDCTIGTKGKTQCRLSQSQALSNFTKFHKLKTN